MSLTVDSRPDSQGWRDRAECADRRYRADWWHPRDDRSYERARSVCERCPVQVECAEHAIARREPHGMWGGLTPAERRSDAA